MDKMMDDMNDHNDSDTDGNDKSLQNTGDDKIHRTDTLTLNSKRDLQDESLNLSGIVSKSADITSAKQTADSRRISAQLSWEYVNSDLKTPKLSLNLNAQEKEKEKEKEKDLNKKPNKQDAYLKANSTSKPNDR